MDQTACHTTQVHSSPGRLRVRNARWKHNVVCLERAEALASSLEGVRSVRSNALTGSLLIHFNPQSSSSETLLRAALRADAPPKTVIVRAAAASPGQTLVSRTARRASRAALAYAAEVLVERAVEVMIAALL